MITFEPLARARDYVDETGLPWPLLVDEHRELYVAYGMRAATRWDVWGPSTWRAYAREIAHGHVPHKSSGDLYQRGGDVVIDASGIVRFHHVGTGPADRPSIAVLLACLDD